MNKNTVLMLIGYFKLRLKIGKITIMSYRMNASGSIFIVNDNNNDDNGDNSDNFIQLYMLDGHGCSLE